MAWRSNVGERDCGRRSRKVIIEVGRRRTDSDARNKEREMRL
jgi:hypothetical protein